MVVSTLKIPRHVLLSYALLYSNFKKKVFYFQRAREALGASDGFTKYLLSKMANIGIVSSRGSTKDRRRKLYYLIDPSIWLNMLAVTHNLPRDVQKTIIKIVKELHDRDDVDGRIALR
ncbi:MAG: hypothetical protein AOA65_2365 [Candidatus Bathyarchaeota archaeon BA1]|nr:MAG: hypothetical protein AOA65_2365 [Candidatus Bathyarchaeota archaeon BA1]